jgi:uncharacterized membrane protein YdbT with pleckstrin-like domain
MMGYVENNLMVGEEIVYQARLHPIALISPLLTIFFGAVIIFIAPVLLPLIRGLTPEVDQLFGLAQPELLGLLPRILQIFGLLNILQGVLGMVSGLVRILTSEFAITNKRVVVKTGFLRRSTIELLLSKIESINVNQTFAGRLLNYGTIIITGTGTTHEPLYNIANPLDFRRQIQQQIVEDQNNQGATRRMM